MQASCQWGYCKFEISLAVAMSSVWVLRLIKSAIGFGHCTKTAAVCMN